MLAPTSRRRAARISSFVTRSPLVGAAPCVRPGRRAGRRLPAFLEQVGQRRQRAADGFLAHGKVVIVRALPLLPRGDARAHTRSEEHTSELQSHHDLVCRLLLEKKKTQINSRSRLTLTF